MSGKRTVWSLILVWVWSFTAQLLIWLNVALGYWRFLWITNLPKFLCVGTYAMHNLVCSSSTMVLYGLLLDLICVCSVLEFLDLKVLMFLLIRPFSMLKSWESDHCFFRFVEVYCYSFWWWMRLSVRFLSFFQLTFLKILFSGEGFTNGLWIVTLMITGSRKDAVIIEVITCYHP